MNQKNSLNQDQKVQIEQQEEKASPPKSGEQIKYYSSDFDYQTYSQQIKDQISQNKSVFSQAQILSITQNSGKSWEQFYKRNKNHFFKDRKYLSIMFERILSHLKPSTSHLPQSMHYHDDQIILLELGCGVGNTIYPLLQLNQNLVIFACDVSPSAIKCVKEHPKFNPKRVHPFCHDLTQSFNFNSLTFSNMGVKSHEYTCTCESEEIKQKVQGSPAFILNSHSVDICTSIFFLSALTFDQCDGVIRIMLKSLRPGGIVYLRDYCLYDLSMRRFDRKKSRIDNDNYVYKRGDGTIAQFFSKDELVQRFRKVSQEETGMDIQLLSSEHETKKSDIGIEVKSSPSKKIKLQKSKFLIFEQCKSKNMTLSQIQNKQKILLTTNQRIQLQPIWKSQQFEKLIQSSQFTADKLFEYKKVKKRKKEITKTINEKIENLNEREFCQIARRIHQQQQFIRVTQNNDIKEIYSIVQNADGPIILYCDKDITKQFLAYDRYQHQNFKIFLCFVRRMRYNSRNKMPFYILHVKIQTLLFPGICDTQKYRDEIAKICNRILNIKMKDTQEINSFTLVG